MGSGAARARPRSRRSASARAVHGPIRPGGNSLRRCGTIPRRFPQRNALRRRPAPNALPPPPRAATRAPGQKGHVLSAAMDQGATPANVGQPEAALLETRKLSRIRPPPLLTQEKRNVRRSGEGGWAGRRYEVAPGQQPGMAAERLAGRAVTSVQATEPAILPQAVSVIGRPMPV